MTIQIKMAKSTDIVADSAKMEKAVRSYLGLSIANSYLPVESIDRIALAAINNARKLKDSGV